MAKTFNINRVNSLPSSGKNGDQYFLRKPNGRYEQWMVVPNGSLEMLKGITDDEQSRLNQLKQDDIDKLKSDYTKAEIDSLFEEVNKGVSGSIKTTQTLTELNALPDGVYEAETEGSYQNGLTAKSGYTTKFQKVGTVWSLFSEVKLPVGTDNINPTGSLLVTEIAVARYALEKYSTRALPEGYEFIPDDRPDAFDESLIVVDSEGWYIPRPTDLIFGTSDRILPLGMSFLQDDRPDSEFEGILIIDKNGWYIPSSSNSSSGSNDFLKQLITYSDFGNVEGYPVEEIKDLDLYYSQWDNIMAGNTSYITKTALRGSGLQNLPIYRYDFKPANPKLKVLLSGCTHGWEKNFSFGLRLFMKHLVENWKGNDALTFLRQNVHFIIVPVVSPDPFVVNFFNGNTTLRDRSGYETPPFNASWTKSGNTVTISFTEADFPVNDRVLFSNYFTSRPSTELVNKVGITFMDSSNATEMPNDVFDIKSIIDNKTVTINVPTSGSGSGTVKMCVKADLNRNADTASWSGLGHAATKTGYPAGFYDNKGTKPFSLAESLNIKDILDNNLDIAFYYDFHSGAGDYVTYISYPELNKDNSFSFIKEMYQNLFNISPVYNLGNTYSSLYVYASESNKIVGSNPEWHAPVVSTGVMNDQQATDMHNWIGNLLTISSKINILNKNK